MRTIDWQGGIGGHIVTIDQTKLPHTFELMHIKTVDDLIVAIKQLSIRGAPALEAAGALGVVLAARWSEDPQTDAANLRAARPTAVNLAVGVDRMLVHLADGPDVVLKEALAVLDEDARRNREIGARGARWLTERIGGRARVQTHCNAGALACVEWGTALGVVHTLLDWGALDFVYVDETRPLLQGARLTAWELEQMGAAYTIVADSASASVLANGLANAVIVGADRIAANGDVVNKVGTYPLALAAHRAGVPFVVAAPESTIDMNTPTGRDVDIELRADDEVTSFNGHSTSPPGASALNLAFDVTPADLVSAIVTESRVITPAEGETP